MAATRAPSRRRADARLAAALGTAPAPLRDDVDALLSTGAGLDALATRLDAIEADVASATRSARQRVQAAHARRLQSMETRDGALVRATIADAAASLTTSLSADHVAPSGATVQHLLARADAALERDRRRWGWVSRTGERAYTAWGEACLYVLLVLVALAPRVARAVGLPVDALLALRAARAGGRAQPPRGGATADAEDGHDSAGGSAGATATVVRE